MSKHRIVLESGIVWLLACRAMLGLDPTHTVGQYGHVAWTDQNGGPQSRVFALTQTSDGDLWLGTESGLLHFDGVRFLPWKPQEGHSFEGFTVVSLAASESGALLAGDRRGLWRIEGGRVYFYKTSTGPAVPGVAAILAGPNGTVVAGTIGFRSGGLCRLEHDSLHCGDANGTLRQGVLSLYKDHLNRIWAGGPTGLVLTEPGQPVLYASLPLTGVRAITEDKDGQIWTADVSDEGLKRLVGDKLVPYQLSSSGERVSVTALLSDRDGGLWIGTSQGLFHLCRGRMDRFRHADGLSADYVRALFEDHEGNVWAATELGVDRFRNLAVATVSTEQGLLRNAGTSGYPSRDGGVWIGAQDGLNYVKGDRATGYTKRDGLTGAITAIFEDRSGGVWADTQYGMTYGEHGRFAALRDPAATKMRMITAAAEDIENRVWFSDPTMGLIRMHGKQVGEIIPWSQFGDDQAWALEADPKRGGLWIGFKGGGIAWFHPPQPLLRYGPAEGLAKGFVSDLHLAEDGTLWITTQHGVSRLRDGRITTIAAGSGLPCDGIHAIVGDNDGSLWFNSACGLMRIGTADLASWPGPWKRPPAEIFDNYDGMRPQVSIFGYFRRAVKSQDGRLWFFAGNAVAVVDSGHLPQNRLAPPVKIESITANHIQYSVGSEVKLPPLTRDLEIEYTAFSFIAPEKVRFRYRLDGSDLDWKSVEGRRQASYTNLSPGPYRFHVIACNNDGVWNQTGAVLDFFIEPAFYQTLLFKLSCIAAIAVMLWLLYRLRVHQIAARLRVRYEARLAERARISRDLHDNLLQNISGFALQINALEKLDSSNKLKDRLHDLRKQAEAWMHEAREAVWDLRSAPALEDSDLPAVLEQTGRQTAKSKQVDFSLTVDGDRRPTPPDLKEQLLRIFQEAVRNAVRHGRPKQIRSFVAYLDDDRVRILIRDDGDGFDLATAANKTGHCGLATMRERAQQIGAEFKITTAPGKGTEVEIVAHIPPPTR